MQKPAPAGLESVAYKRDVCSTHVLSQLSMSLRLTAMSLVAGTLSAMVTPDTVLFVPDRMMSLKEHFPKDQPQKNGGCAGDRGGPNVQRKGKPP